MMMNVAMRKIMKVTSLTGKQVSTDSSKVIGEEARARLEVLGIVRGSRVSLQERPVRVGKQKQLVKKQSRRWTTTRSWDELNGQEKLHLQKDLLGIHLVPGRRSRYRQSLKLLRSGTEMTP